MNEFSNPTMIVSLFHSFLKYGFSVQPTLPICMMSLFSVFFLPLGKLLKSICKKHIMEYSICRGVGRRGSGGAFSIQKDVVI